MTKHVFPGMLDRSKEYFIHNGEVMMICEGKVSNFSEVENHPELAKIISEEKDVAEILGFWCGNDEQKQMRTLAKCRFGGLNFHPDFSESNESEGDFRDCSFRGNCIGENIVCQPIKINGQPSTTKEINLLKEFSTDKKNEVIAEDLNIPLGTLNHLRTITYKKFNIQTKQHSAILLMQEGLL